MDTLIQEARKKNFEIQTVLPELAQAYTGLIIRQNDMYDAICLEMEKMERAQFEMNSKTVIQYQVFVANVPTAFAVMRTQSTNSTKTSRKRS
jgi:hypothetical protein